MASSRVRSRTAMARVLPVTSNKVKKTTAPIKRIRDWIGTLNFWLEAERRVLAEYRSAACQREADLPSLRGGDGGDLLRQQCEP